MFEQVKELLGLSGLREASSESWALQMSGPWRREVIIVLTFGT